MKAGRLFAFGALVAGTLLYVLMGADPPRPRPTAETSVTRAATTREPAPIAEAQEPANEAVLVLATAPLEVAATKERRTLDGTLTDRFGSPIAGERVFLVDEKGDHPPRTAELTDYVTALTSPSGGFSLSLSNDGPWRLAVGPPGAPRVPISAPRLLTRTTSAEVVVPGSAVLRIAFDALPEGGDPIRLEVLSLRDPRTTDGRRGKGGNRGERAGTETGQTRSRRRQRDREAGTGNSRRGGGAATEGAGQGGDDRRSSLDVRSVPRDRAAPALAASIALEGEQLQESERRGGQRGQGRRGQDRGLERGTTPGQPSADENAAQGPPPEQWRALRRHELTAEQRESRVVEFERFPTGPVCRLALFQGGLSLEGGARFTLQEDAVMEVRVLPFDGGASSSLSYTTSLRFLPPEDRPAGVRWRD